MTTGTKIKGVDSLLALADGRIVESITNGVRLRVNCDRFEIASWLPAGNEWTGWDAMTRHERQNTVHPMVYADDLLQWSFEVVG